MNKSPNITLFSVSVFWLIAAGFLFFHPFNRIDKKPISTTYHYSSIKVQDLSFDTVKIDNKNVEKIKFFYKDKDNQKYTTINSLKGKKESLVFAINGGIFSKKYEPLGLYIEKGKVISNINLNQGGGNFFLQPNGVFLIKQNKVAIVETKKYKHSSDISFAIQSGPLLLINNRINQAFNKDSKSKHIRNGVGIDEKGNVLFAISNQPVTFYEFAEFFKTNLGCKNALYLDGTISEMYVEGMREKSIMPFTVIIGVEKT